MAKNEFDMDFSFEDEFDLDSDIFQESEDNTDFDLGDLAALLGEEPAAPAAAPKKEDTMADLDLSLTGLDLDLSDLDLSDLDLGEELPAERDEPEQEEPLFTDVNIAESDELADEDWDATFLDEEPAYQAEEEEEDFDEPDFFTGRSPRAQFPQEEEEEFDASDFDEADFESSVYGRKPEPAPYEPAGEDSEFDEPEDIPGMPARSDSEPDDDDPEEDEEEDEAKEERRAREREERRKAQEEQRKARRKAAEEKRQRDKAAREKAGPSFLDKFLAYYMAPLKEPAQDPNNPRRRRRPSKARIFKEVYLPPVLAGATLILVLAFAIGSISNAIARKEIDDAQAQRESQSQAQQEQAQQAEALRIVEEAKELAQGYNYGEAIAKLDSYSGDMTQEMIALRAEYQNTESQLVEFKDYTSIPNLSFQMLIADPARAFADKELGGKYNQNFVTVDEFEKILQQLYDGGFVLVDFSSFTEAVTGLDGNANFFPVPIKLPAGKKPVMITQTMVNYLGYMVDSNDDGEPDAGGAGFAYRLVVNDQGDIKAQMIDANGQTQTGNYDLVPILEDFIKAHPDFSYKGAKATLAVTGEEGVFGYRTLKSYISSKGQAYYDEQVLGAQTVVNALRSKGYRIACFTFGNKAYGELTGTQIQADLQEWTNEITPVIGEVDTLVFARTSDIGDYSGTKFEVLYKTGFRYFVKHGSDTYAEINNTYVRQTRLMVTGENMAWHSDMFSDYFDCAPLMNNLRGNVPKSA